MTKYLVKIISICAFVVLIPVIIAGVALSVIGTSLHKLDLAVVGATDPSHYNLTVERKDTGDKQTLEGSKGTFQFQNNTELALSVSDFKGYKFLGWYKGSAEANQEVIAENLVEDATTYSFTITGYTQLAAIFEQKTFNIKFQGFYDDGTEYTHAAVSVHYGDRILPQADEPQSKKAEGKEDFLGWKITSQKGYISNGNVFTADFEDETDTYIAEPQWTGKMKVEFRVKDTDEMIDFTYVDEAGLHSLQLPQDNKINSFFDHTGYKKPQTKVWTKGQDEEVTTFQGVEYQENGTLTVYLNRELKIYTINIKNGETPDQTVAVKYDVENKFNTDDVASIPQTIKRNYYDLKGIDIGGVQYLAADGDKLGAALVAGETETAEATAIWECQYNTISINFSAIYNGGDVYGSESGNGDDIEYTLAEDAVDNNPVSNNIPTFHPGDNFKLEQQVFATLFKGIDYKAFYANGRKAVKYGNSFTIMNNGENKTDNVSLEQATFAYLIERYLTIGGTAQDGVLTIKVQFNYVLAD